MASAEARAKWLRYANGYIIQEDYKGASRPASIPPSSSSKPQSDGSPGEGVTSNDSSADTKWWLNHWETLEKQEYAKIHELKAVVDGNLQKKPMVGDLWSEEDNFHTSEKPKKLFSEMESEWIKIKKAEPWWRTADLNDLASFASHKSPEHFDNCDLPQPDRWSVPDKGLASLSTTTSDDAENTHTLNSELSRAQLLDALRHSQTRAREAEKAAQQALNEKQHLITHFLRQASHLFAYKQWLHILQLETLCLQLRNNKHHPIYTRFPDFVQQKRVRRKLKRDSPRCKTGKSFGSFLLGLTLAGAGLLLGWTLGWLFR